MRYDPIMDDHLIEGHSEGTLLHELKLLISDLSYQITDLDDKFNALVHYRIIQKAGDPSRSLDFLELDVRPSTVLRAMGIETIGQLTDLTVMDLLTKRNCGRVTVQHIQERLERWGLSLRIVP